MLIQFLETLSLVSFWVGVSAILGTAPAVYLECFWGTE